MSDDEVLSERGTFREQYKNGVKNLNKFIEFDRVNR
jgi:hypothetical protein